MYGGGLLDIGYYLYASIVKSGKGIGPDLVSIEVGLEDFIEEFDADLSQLPLYLTSDTWGRILGILKIVLEVPAETFLVLEGQIELKGYICGLSEFTIPLQFDPNVVFALRGRALGKA
jgi:hypothetical protein